MSFNVWQPQGVVIPAVSGDAPEQPTVLYDANPHILSPNPDGKVFKMWFTTGPLSSLAGLTYAESHDGLSWTRNGTLLLSGNFWGSRVYKHGSTYYLYTSAGVFSTHIESYTSPDGITWTLANATALVPDGKPWDIFIGQLNVCDVVAGVWYGYFFGADNNTSNANFYTGLATSTDGLSWTQSASNPVASLLGGTYTDGQTWNLAGDFTFVKVGSVYYGWAQVATIDYPQGANDAPCDLMRWYALSPAGPWTPLPNLALNRTTDGEGVNTGGGQVADPSFVEVNGQCYMYYTADNNIGSGANYVIEASIASMTAAQLVLTREGVQNYPLSGAASQNFSTTASDNFQRADGSLGPNWSDVTGLSGSAQIISHEVTSSAINANADSYYSGTAFAADQWAQIIVAACANNSFIGVDLRASATAAYRLYWNGTLGTSGSFAIQKWFGGNFTQLLPGNAPISGLTLHAGDTITGVIIGSRIMYFWNGVMIAAVTDTDIATGSPGLLAVPATNVTDTFISGWSGGTFKDAPLAPIIGVQVIATTPTAPIGRAPRMNMRKSTDGGHNFGNETTRDCGESGNFRTRVRWLQLGRARDLVIEISGSDPIPWRIVDGYLDVTEGSGE
jgi:hypothetical protein